MFDLTVSFLKQEFELIPILITICIVFDFLGNFFFGKK